MTEQLCGPEPDIRVCEFNTQHQSVMSFLRNPFVLSSSIHLHKQL